MIDAEFFHIMAEAQQPHTIVSPETWTPEQRGRALHMIYVLANTEPSKWRSKKELHAALSEFRTVHS